MDNHQDLISRKAAIEEILKFCPEKTKPGSFDEYGAMVLCGVIDVILKQLPAVDAVPVVRCRDCKHRDPEDKKCDCGGMAVQGLYFPRPDDWYCADGERRDDDADN